MISVAEAEHIISLLRPDWGVEAVPLSLAVGRVLAQPIVADRDLPPYDRVAMDGIAIRYADYAAGQRDFDIVALQSAGQAPVHWANTLALSPAVEIMTGAILPPGLDTVIPYEHLRIEAGRAHVGAQPVKSGQNIHRRATDRCQQEVLVPPGCVLGAAEIGIAASVGLSAPQVTKWPRVGILSSGDELVEVTDAPLPYQIRRSNVYAVAAALQSRLGIHAVLQHIPDDLETAKASLRAALQHFDVLLLSGGVSAGKFDYLPQALESRGVRCLFHQVNQRPGKPFWFGAGAEGQVVFAFPGNPVSTFVCVYRYLLPWLTQVLGLPSSGTEYATLGQGVKFEPALTRFLPVCLKQQGALPGEVPALSSTIAVPVPGNGSGDFSSLAGVDGFLELPAEVSFFPEGEAHRLWRCR